MAAVLLTIMPRLVAGETRYAQRWVNEFRDGPGSYFLVKGTIARGAPLGLLKRQGDWAQVNLAPLNGDRRPVGWLALSGLGPEPPRNALVDAAQAMAGRLVSTARPAAMVAAVRGFAVRYSRAKPQALDDFLKLGPPFFSPAEYAAFNDEPGAPKAAPPGRALPAESGGLLADYDAPLEERGIGLGLASAVAARGLVEDRSLLRYVNLVAAGLAEASGAYAQPFSVYVSSGAEVNAVSVPGGYIFLAQSLVSACRDEAELAAVIAHEMTHIIKRHGLKEIKARGVALRADQAMAELDQEAGPGGDAESEAQLTDFADSAYETAHKPRLEAYEEEADAGALLILARAGYDPVAVPRMIERVSSAVVAAQTIDNENPFARMDYRRRQQKAEAFLRENLRDVRGVAEAERFRRLSKPARR